MLYESQRELRRVLRTKPWRALHRLRSYEYVRDLLKVRQWRTREDADRKDRTFVLKSPMHLECADALLHMLPTQGFTLVRMHREPLDVVLSLATMLAYIQALQSDRPQPAAVLEYWVGRLERMLAAPSPTTIASARGRTSTLSTLRTKSSFATRPAPPRACWRRMVSLSTRRMRQRLRGLREAHPRNATGGGRFHDLGVFGSALTEGEIAARFDFYGDGIRAALHG